MGCLKQNFTWLNEAKFCKISHYLHSPASKVCYNTQNKSMLNIRERFIELKKPRPWTSQDWVYRRSYDVVFDECYRDAQYVLRMDNPGKEMGLSGDGRSLGLMQRYLTMKFLLVEQRFVCKSEKDKRSIEKVIDDVKVDTQKYIEHFFPDEEELAVNIQHAMNYLYFLGTNGETSKYGLDDEGREIWKNRYGTIS